MHEYDTSLPLLLPTLFSFFNILMDVDLRDTVGEATIFFFSYSVILRFHIRQANEMIIISFFSLLLSQVHKVSSSLFFWKTNKPQNLLILSRTSLLLEPLSNGCLCQAASRANASGNSLPGIWPDTPKRQVCYTTLRWATTATGVASRWSPITSEWPMSFWPTMASSTRCRSTSPIRPVTVTFAASTPTATSPSSGPSPLRPRRSN